MFRGLKRALTRKVPVRHRVRVVVGAVDYLGGGLDFCRVVLRRGDRVVKTGWAPVEDGNAWNLGVGLTCLQATLPYPVLPATVFPVDRCRALCQADHKSAPPPFDAPPPGLATH